MAFQTCCETEKSLKSPRLRRLRVCVFPLRGSEKHGGCTGAYEIFRPAPQRHRELLAPDLAWIKPLTTSWHQLQTSGSPGDSLGGVMCIGQALIDMSDLWTVNLIRWVSTQITQETYPNNSSSSQKHTSKCQQVQAQNWSSTVREIGTRGWANAWPPFHLRHLWTCCGIRSCGTQYKRQNAEIDSKVELRILRTFTSVSSVPAPVSMVGEACKVNTFDLIGRCVIWRLQRGCFDLHKGNGCLLKIYVRIMRKVDSRADSDGSRRRYPNKPKVRQNPNMSKVLTKPCSLFMHCIMKLKTINNMSR